MKHKTVWSIVDFVHDKVLSDPHYDQLPVPIREAHLFRNVLERMPIGLPRKELLAGDFGWDWGEPDELMELERQIDEEQRSHSASRPPASPVELLRNYFHCFGSYTMAHTCVDYERVTSEGIAGILAQIREEKVQDNSEKKYILEGMEIALDAVIRWAERYANLADELALQEDEEKERVRLKKIASICHHVPRFPARNFHEAVQSIWFIHAAIGLSERSGASLSLGRLDQYLYPLFCRDIERGTDEAELEAILSDLFRKLNRFGDPACAVNLGGVDENGSDLFNPLSGMILRLAGELHLPSPLLAARIHEDIPEDVFDMLVDPDLLIMGQPTFYGEFPCREALIRRGVPEAEVHQWAVNNCMGLIMPGAEVSDMWGGVVNLLLPLELAANKGQPLHHEIPIPLKTSPQGEYETFEQLLDTFTAYMDEIVEFCIRQNQRSTRDIGREHPNPFLSALFRDCIERGKDRALGGPRYHTVIIEAFGLVNASDALLAVQKLVFDKKCYSLDELVKAEKQNFDGFPSLHRALLNAPKYGNNDLESDAMAETLAKQFAHSVSRHTDSNACYAPSFHTLNAHIGAGRKMGASLDGRLAGQPLAKNIGTMPGRNLNGHTALMLSAASIDQSEFYGGQALDISVDLNTLSTNTDRKKFQALLQTYFSLGGLQVQVNGISADVLRAAMVEPEMHQDVIVKIAGYSARFVSLGRDMQQEMIQRFECGL